MELKINLLLAVWCLLIQAASANLKGRLYLNNYITAIEDDSTEPASFMVTTADSNFAIFSPRFHRLGWQGVTVNEEQIFIVTISNTTLIGRMLDLDEEERDLIAEVRANFLQNLTGLKLSRAVASDSLLMLSNKLAYVKPGLEDKLKLSQAEQAIRLINSVTQLGREPEEESAKQDDESEATTTKEAGPQKRHQTPRRAAKSRKFMQKTRSSEYSSYKSQSYGTTSDESYQSSGLGFCSRKLQAQFSYNNLADSSLKESLCGDIYNFDLRCNILDVYSSSVSIKQAAGLSVLYRNENYFAYSRSDLPRHINRLFLINDKVFFVYHDRSLLLKHDWLLDPLELEVVIGTRRQLRAESNDGAQTSGHAHEDEPPETSDQAAGNEQQAGSAASGQRALASGGKQ